jgi:hypothetical protein
MIHWIYQEFTKLSTIFIIFTQWVVHWEDIVDRFAGWLKLSHLYERRKGETKMPEIMSYLGIISKIAIEAPALLPDAMKILTDIGQVNTDFQKLINDFNGIKASAAAAPVAASTTPPTAA